VDPSDQSHVYAQTFINVTLALPAHWWQLWWVWVLIAVAAVTVLAVAMLRIHSWRAKRNMEEIEIILYGGEREIDTLQAPAGCGRRFAFSIDLSRPGLPRLEADVAGASEFVARRWIDGRSGGGLMLTMPGGEKHEMGQDTPTIAVGDGTSLGFRDLRMAEVLAQASDWAADDNGLGADQWNSQRRWWRRRGDEEMLAQPDGEEQSLPRDDYEGEYRL
jgi:hypothetical protein